MIVLKGQSKHKIIAKLSHRLLGLMAGQLIMLFYCVSMPINHEILSEEILGLSSYLVLEEQYPWKYSFMYTNYNMIIA